MIPYEDSIISSSNICLFVSFQLPFVSLCLSVCCFSLSLSSPLPLYPALTLSACQSASDCAACCLSESERGRQNEVGGAEGATGCHGHASALSATRGRLRVNLTVDVDAH